MLLTFSTTKSLCASSLTHQSHLSHYIRASPIPNLARSSFMGHQSSRLFSTSDMLQYDKNNDYYKLMGVSPTDDLKAIKKSYYKLAQQYHPDKAGDCKESMEKFKKISQAYEVLSDEQMKARYDQLRNNP